MNRLVDPFWVKNKLRLSRDIRFSQVVFVLVRVPLEKQPVGYLSYLSVSIYPSIYLSIYLPATYLSIYYLSISRFMARNGLMQLWGLGKQVRL